MGGGKHFVTVGLVADDFVGEPKEVAPEELTDWGWFDLERLPKPLFFPSRNVLDCYLAGRVNRC
jgi:8-oxo-dGTP diphosphatase